MLKLVGWIFVAYENTTFPLAFPTCRATNESLQRELCNVEVWCLFMFFRPGLALQPTTMSLCWNWWEIFIAYAPNKSPLAFPTCRSTKKYLQRELCNVEVQGRIMVLLKDVEAMNNYQCNWTRTKVVISWWLKALLQLFKTEKRRCNFDGTWTSSVPTEDCVDVPFSFDALHLFKQIWA